ncbi:MAG TPA: hypothetical protein P5112_01390 [Bacteroidales bacterium]|nr:hypothetical protein [Bacteroidales bacterium]
MENKPSVGKFMHTFIFLPVIPDRKKCGKPCTVRGNISINLFRAGADEAMTCLFRPVAGMAVHAEV